MHQEASAQDSVAALYDNGAAFADWENESMGLTGASGESF